MAKEPNGYDKIMMDFITLLILRGVDPNDLFPSDDFVNIQVKFPKKVIDALTSIPVLEEMGQNVDFLKESLADLIYKSFVVEVIRCYTDFNDQINSTVQGIIQKMKLMNNVSLN